MKQQKQMKRMKEPGGDGLRPSNTLYDNEGNPLTTNFGQFITTNNPGDNMPTLDNYRPYRHDKDDTIATTDVVADNPTDPTNWDTARTVVFPAMPVGEYEVLAEWTWLFDSAADSALFRAGINSNFGSLVSYEPKDGADIAVENWNDIFTHSATGDITIQLDFLKASADVDPLTITKTLFRIKKVTD